jgi:hypothetical protein
VYKPSRKHCLECSTFVHSFFMFVSQVFLRKNYGRIFIDFRIWAEVFTQHARQPTTAPPSYFLPHAHLSSRGTEQIDIPDKMAMSVSAASNVFALRPAVAGPRSSNKRAGAAVPRGVVGAQQRVRANVAVAMVRPSHAAGVGGEANDARRRRQQHGFMARGSTQALVGARARGGAMAGLHRLNPFTNRLKAPGFNP